MDSRAKSCLSLLSLLSATNTYSCLKCSMLVASIPETLSPEALSSARCERLPVQGDVSIALSELCLRNNKLFFVQFQKYVSAARPKVTKRHGREGSRTRFCSELRRLSRFFGSILFLRAMAFPPSDLNCVRTDHATSGSEQSETWLNKDCSSPSFRLNTGQRKQ